MIDEIIAGRMSTYPEQFIQGRKIEDHLIIRLLENASKAPSHKLTQPWSFIVFKEQGVQLFYETQLKIYLENNPVENQNQKKLEKYNNRKNLVSHVIAVICTYSDDKKVPAIEETIAVGCAIENIYLSLNEYQIAGYLSTGEICYTHQMRRFLELNEHQVCAGFFVLGVKNNDLMVLPKKRIPAQEKLRWFDGKTE